VLFRSTQRQRNGDRPTVDLSASASYTRNYGTSSSPFAGNYRTGAIGVQLNYPLYTGGLNQSRVRQALANEEKARQDLESARRAVAQAARQAYTGVDLGMAQIRALESAERSARSQLDSTVLGYQVGVRINLDVLNAQSLLLNTQRDLKKARYDYLINGLRLQTAAGDLTEEDVRRVNALLR
jgi:outer membrane protein